MIPFLCSASIVPRIMTPPQPITIDVSKEKKGKKGKGKSKRDLKVYKKVSVIKYFRMISYDEIFPLS